ncbi:unnamed protein product, partial [Sphacelaria rigidula]
MHDHEYTPTPPECRNKLLFLQFTFCRIPPIPTNPQPSHQLRTTFPHSCTTPRSLINVLISTLPIPRTSLGTNTMSDIESTPGTPVQDSFTDGDTPTENQNTRSGSIDIND